jgi:hypothetical protein
MNTKYTWLPLMLICACIGDPGEKADSGGSSGSDGAGGGGGGSGLNARLEMGNEMPNGARCVAKFDASGPNVEMPCPDCSFRLEAAWQTTYTYVGIETPRGCEDSGLEEIEDELPEYATYLSENNNIWAFGIYNEQDVAVIGYEYEAEFSYSVVFQLDWNRGSGEFSMTLYNYGYYDYEDSGGNYSWYDSGGSEESYTAIVEASGTARP